MVYDEEVLFVAASGRSALQLSTNNTSPRYTLLTLSAWRSDQRTMKPRAHLSRSESRTVLASPGDVWANSVLRMETSNGSEIRRIRRLVAALKGVSEANVDYLHCVILVKYDPRIVSLDRLRALVGGPLVAGH